jgi:hypothetical protein
MTQPLTLTIKCPDILGYQTSPFSKSIKSYKLATGADILFHFSETIPDLEMCTQVTAYTQIDVIYTDLNGIAYAADANTLSASPTCTQFPCLTLTFDVTKSGIIKFKIQPIDAAG